MNVEPRRTSRRVVVQGLAALPVGVVAAACGQTGQGTPPNQAAPSGPVKGKVLVMSYQTSAPRLDWQVAMYEDFNKEFKPKGLEVEFVNPGQSVIEKVTALHVAGTPADMWE